MKVKREERDYSSVSFPKKMMRIWQAHIEEHPELGYVSVSDFLRSASRKQIDRETRKETRKNIALCEALETMLKDEEHAQEEYKKLMSDNPLVKTILFGIEKDEKKHYEQLKEIYRYACGRGLK